MASDQNQPAPTGTEERWRFRFLREFRNNVAAAIAILVLSLTVGTLGYHYIAGMQWIDAFANAAMMATSMGPLDPLTSNPARIFGAFFALYAGFALAFTTGLLVAPMLQSFVRRLHAGHE